MFWSVLRIFETFFFFEPRACSYLQLLQQPQSFLIYEQLLFATPTCIYSFLNALTST